MIKPALKSGVLSLHEPAQGIERKYFFAAKRQKRLERKARSRAIGAGCAQIKKPTL
jgi:hypothetical protein